MFAEPDSETRLVDALVRSGRIEIRWGGSNIKYVELRDRLTGTRTSGRSYVNWNTALSQAVHKMRRSMTEELASRPTTHTQASSDQALSQST